jgi:phage tail-like protein
MAALPERRYAQFSFLVQFSGSSRGADAGFQEINGIGLDTGLAGRARKVSGLNKATDVTLKRGVIGSAGFQQWLDDIRAAGKSAVRDVTVQMQNEEHRVVKTWKLVGARIIKHTSGPMNAKGTDVAMEELVLGYDRLEVGE